MPRATNTYVVMLDGRPAAAFTVKYELAQWVKGRPGLFADPAPPVIWRLSDGDRTKKGPEILPLSELLG